MKNNEKGSILIVTIGFVLVFTLLGMASIYLATLENEVAEKQKSSTEAFWLADGAIEIARSRLPVVIPEDTAAVHMKDGQGSDDPNRSYDVYSKKYIDPNTAYEYQYRWVAESEGAVLGEERAIYALIDNYSIPDDPITTPGPIGDVPAKIIFVADNPNEPAPEPGIDPTISLEKTVFKTIDELEDIAVLTDTNYVIKEPDKRIVVSESVTVIKFEEDGGRVQVLTNQSEGGFVVVDATTATQDVEIEITDPDGLRGVLFVIGDATLVNPDIDGTVISDGQLTLAGEGEIRVSSQAIDEALGGIGAIAGGGDPKIVAWKEQ